MSSLDVLVKASSNLNCRDKSVKVLQYGARMILGYYSSILQVDSATNLQTILTTCTLGRRSFRLFRSINHIQLLILKLDKLSNKNFFLSVQNRVYVVECIEAFEQLCWALFFLFDNIIFGIKMGVLDLRLQKYEGLFFPCWFAADASMFIKTAISLYGNMQTRRAIKMNLHEKESLFSVLDGKRGGFNLGFGARKIKEEVDENKGGRDDGVSSNVAEGAETVNSSHDTVGGGDSDGMNSNTADDEDITEEDFDHSSVEHSDNFVATSLSEELLEIEKIMRKDNKVETAEDPKIVPTTADVSQKKNLNISDFANTSISEILNSNTNITKILSTERITGKDIKNGKNGTRYDYLSVGSKGAENSNGDAVTSADDVRDLDANSLTVGSTTNEMSSPVGGNSLSDSDENSGVEISKSNINICIEGGNDVEEGEVSKYCTDCTDDISDVDTNVVQKHSHNTQENSYTLDNTTDTSALEKIRALDKQDRELYWKLVKSIVDMGVSGSFNRQLPVKKVIGEGGLGVLGVISASMAIYEEIKK